MVDRDLILVKAGAVKRHSKRAIKRADVDLSEFLKDIDCQDIVIFNLQMAIQNCIYIAAHIISDEDLGIPGSTNEMFYTLEENGYLNKTVTEKMVAAVGFRNLIVHEYVKLDLKQVHQTAQKNVLDLNDFLKSIFRKTGIEEMARS
ncbi:MAG: DUF86 domain-containing protein [Deltaproteobacteria bacterium]|nr:DUF86 domain-containing protein [Deltaproteobacteria bacterium]